MHEVTVSCPSFHIYVTYHIVCKFTLNIFNTLHVYFHAAYLSIFISKSFMCFCAQSLGNEIPMLESEVPMHRENKVLQESVLHIQEGMRALRFSLNSLGLE